MRNIAAISLRCTTGLLQSRIADKNTFCNSSSSKVTKNNGCNVCPDRNAHPTVDADIFLGATHFQDAILLTRAAQELDFNPQALVMTAGPGFQEFVDELGGASEFIMSPTQWSDTMTWDGLYLGSPADYAERYSTMWDEAPTYQAAESTAAGLALQAAIEAAGSLDSDAVRQALKDLDIITFYGPINFDDTGKNTGKPMATFQIQDAVNVVVAAVADLVYPLPAWEDK